MARSFYSYLFQAHFLTILYLSHKTVPVPDQAAVPLLPLPGVISGAIQPATAICGAWMRLTDGWTRPVIKQRALGRRGRFSITASVSGAPICGPAISCSSHAGAADMSKCSYDGLIAGKPNISPLQAIHAASAGGGMSARFPALQAAYGPL